MLLVARVPQDRLLAVAAATGAPGQVGPTSGAGWTSLRSAAAAGVATRLPDVDRMLLLGSRGGPVLRVLPAVPAVPGAAATPGPGVRSGLEVSWPPEGPSPAAVKAALAVLTGWFDTWPGGTGAAAPLWVDDGVVDVATILAKLDAVLMLPHVPAPEPTAAVVAWARPLPDDDRVVRTLRGGAYLAAAPRDWRVLRPLPPGVEADPDEAGRLAAALSTADAGERSVLVLWRDDGGAGAGAQVWRGGRLVGAHHWHPTVRLVRPAGSEVEAEAAFSRAVGTLGGASVEPDRLAGLLLAGPVGGDPLAELVDALGLPDDLVRALDHPDDFGRVEGVRLVGRTAWPRRLVDRLERRMGGPPSTPSARVSAAVIAALFVVVEIGLATMTVGVATVLSDGVTGGAGTLAVVVLAAATLICLPVMVARVRLAVARPPDPG